MRTSEKNKEIKKINDFRQNSKDKLKAYMANAQVYCQNRHLLDEIISCEPNFVNINLDY